jgi:hypothetical protein
VFFFLLPNPFPIQTISSYPVFLPNIDPIKFCQNGAPQKIKLKLKS